MRTLNDDAREGIADLHALGRSLAGANGDRARAPRSVSGGDAHLGRRATRRIGARTARVGPRARRVRVDVGPSARDARSIGREALRARTTHRSARHRRVLRCRDRRRAAHVDGWSRSPSPREPHASARSIGRNEHRRRRSARRASPRRCAGRSAQEPHRPLRRPTESRCGEPVRSRRPREGAPREEHQRLLHLVPSATARRTTKTSSRSSPTRARVVSGSSRARPNCRRDLAAALGAQGDVVAGSIEKPSSRRPRAWKSPASSAIKRCGSDAPARSSRSPTWKAERSASSRSSSRSPNRSRRTASSSIFARNTSRPAAANTRSITTRASTSAMPRATSTGGERNPPPRPR